MILPWMDIENNFFLPEYNNKSFLPVVSTCNTIEECIMPMRTIGITVKERL